jgi:hypothetical protein
MGLTPRLAGQRVVGQQHAPLGTHSAHPTTQAVGMSHKDFTRIRIKLS